MSDPKKQSVGRRGFFRDALLGFVKPLAEYVNVTDDAPKPRLLRPPGALPENLFLNACSCSGRCIEVCPASAIIQLKHNDPKLDGTPVVDPMHSACVVCDSLACTHVCPGGALVSLLEPTQIHMGVAILHPETCIRTHGETCNTCVDTCPLGAVAIVINDDGPPDVLDGCVGCGVCEFHCPTTPRAIVIEPI